MTKLHSCTCSAELYRRPINADHLNLLTFEEVQPLNNSTTRISTTTNASVIWRQQSCHETHEHQPTAGGFTFIRINKSAPTWHPILRCSITSTQEEEPCAAMLSSSNHFFHFNHVSFDCCCQVVVKHVRTNPLEPIQWKQSKGTNPMEPIQQSIPNDSSDLVGNGRDRPSFVAPNLEQGCNRWQANCKSNLHLVSIRHFGMVAKS